MYKHEVNDDEDNEENEEDAISDDECDIEDVNDNDKAENTFFNPSVETDTEKTTETETEELKCELCVFKTKDKARFTIHMKEIHSVKGKYVCTRCEREFGTRKEFNGHKYHGCGGWLDRHISKDFK